MIHPYIVDEWNISIFKMKDNYSNQRDNKGKISIFVFRREASYHDIIGLMDRNATVLPIPQTLEKKSYE